MIKVHSACDKGLLCMSLRISNAASLKHLQATKQFSSGAMHFVAEHHQNAENSGGFDETRPAILRNLISSSVKTPKLGLTPRSCVWARNVELYLVTPVRV